MLIGNYQRANSSVGIEMGVSNTAVNYFKGPRFANFWVGDSSVTGQTEKSSFFVSSGPHYTLAFAPKAGGLSSRNNTTIDLDPTGLLVAGLPGSGSTTITFSSTATGGLIVSGTGTATITFSPTGSLISVASGSGSSTITFSSAASIGAPAGLSGTTTIELTPTAGSYAIGYLSGTATNEVEFSADALARAVWEALASDFNTAGTMGEKLNSASSAGDPWSTSLPGAYADGTAGKILGSKVLTLSKFLGLK